jgi:hypothetical protein
LLFLQLIQPTPPNVPTPPATGINLPSDITSGGLLLLAGWIILNQLPGLLKSVGNFLNTIISSRAGMTDAFAQLSERLDKDREFYDGERTRLEARIGELEKKIDNLISVEIASRDKTITLQRITIERYERLMRDKGIVYEIP